MKSPKTTRLLVHLGFLVLLSPMAFCDDEWTAIIEKVKPSVVTVVSQNDKGETDSQGSGFFISGDRLVTNRHVVEGAEQAAIRLVTGATYPVKGIIAESVENDLVILSIKIPKKTVKPLELSPVAPKEGQDIMVVGSPYGLDQTVSTGIVSSIRDLPGYEDMIQITAPISPGSSGGPILDRSGKVVGVVVSQMTSGQNLNFSIAASCIKELKESKLISLSSWGKSKSSSLEKSFQSEMSSGMASAKAGDYSLAVEHFQEAIRLNPKEANAYYLLGYPYMKLQRYEEAVSALKQAIRLQPEDASAHYYLGMVYGNLQRHEEAVSAYKQAIRLQPEDAEKHAALGSAYRKLERYEDAISAYKQAIRLRPEDADAHYFLGGAYFILQRYEEAVSAYKQAIRLQPEDADAHVSLGNTYRKLERYEDAISAYKQAIRLQPDMAWAHLFLGSAYLQKNDQGSALDEYRILKNLDKELANELFNLIYPE